MNTRKDKQIPSSKRAGYDSGSAGKSAAGSTAQGRERDVAKATIPEQKGCGPTVTEYPFLDKEVED